MMHEFHAGTILLEKRLSKVPSLIVKRHEMGWVKDEKTFDDADAIVCFSDGNKRHPVLAEESRIQTIENLVKKELVLVVSTMELKCLKMALIQ